MPILLAALLGAACSTGERAAAPDAAVAVVPSMLLVGQRAVRAGARLQFDAERPPALRIEGKVPPDLRATLVFDGGGVELGPPQAEARAGGHLVRFGAPADAPVGDATLRVEAAGATLTWPARWDVPPGRRPALRAAQGGDAEALARARAALPTMAPEDRAWAAVEVARLARRVEGAEAGIDAAVAAADAAADLPSERARRLRAAAFQALWARRFPRALELLDAVEAASASLGDLGALDAALDH